MSTSHKYNDVKFFLIAIAFISAFNYYLTWSNIMFNWKKNCIIRSSEVDKTILKTSTFLVIQND